MQILIAIAVIVLSGCQKSPGEKSVAAGKALSEKEFPTASEESKPELRKQSLAIASASELPACDADAEAQLAYAVQEKTFHVCKNTGVWEIIELVPEPKLEISKEKAGSNCAGGGKKIVAGDTTEYICDDFTIIESYRAFGDGTDYCTKYDEDTCYLSGIYVDVFANKSWQVKVDWYHLSTGGNDAVSFSSMPSHIFNEPSGFIWHRVAICSSTFPIP
jgi:hypothetical protein